MQVTETKSEGLSREFKIAVPAAEIDERIDARLKDIAGQAQMPGFRPGKVPVSLLKKRYGDAVRGEVLEQTVNTSSQRMVSEQGIRPAGQPKIEVTTFEEGSDLEFTMTLDVMPDIEPIDFSKITLEKMVVKVDDKDVDEQLERLADMHKESQPISGNRAAKKGDVLVIDFVGKIDDKAFDGGSAEGYNLELGSGSFIPGFEDQLIGVKAGDEKEIKVTFPEEYGAEELAGKDAVFECKVHEIREPVAVPIDDELAKKMGKDSLDDLKQAMAEERGREYGEMTRMHLKRSLLDQLSDIAEFDIPPGLLEDEFNSIWEQFQQEKEQGNLDEEEAAKSDDEHKQELQEIAERRVRLGLLLSEIGRTNEIQVGQDEINRALFQAAQRYPGQEQQVIEFYRSNPEAMQQLSGPLYEDKVVDYILELAKVTEKSVTLDELLKAPEEAAKKKPSGKKKAAPKKKAASKTTAKSASETDGKDEKPAKKKAAPKKKSAAKKE